MSLSYAEERFRNLSSAYDRLIDYNPNVLNTQQHKSLQAQMDFL